ncbi:MAG: alcohol dehydrogenase catalytic domain-containing protein [Lachnospiraceae bacterium]|nr:alcohol dehydrogenase catalytic domain-containing protein [Lachnospiraceae bacterium]
MKTLVYHGPGKLEIEEWDLPEPKAGEVRLKLQYAAICGSDLGAYKNASDRFRPPLILGHEASGIVDQLGEGVKELRVGQHVCCNPPIYCGTCWYCTHGHYNICPNRLSLGNSVGVAACNGTFAEYICLPEYTLVPLPDTVSLLHGSLMEPLAVGYHAAQNGSFTPGETTAVIGTGPIGLLTILSLRALGAGKIVCSDTSVARLDMARQLGADITVDAREDDLAQVVKEATDGLGADRTIICTDAVPAFQQAIRATRNCGDVVLVGMIQKKVDFCPMDIFGRDINIISSYTFTDEIFEAVDAVAGGKIQLDPLISSIYSLEHGKDAFDALATPGNPELKVSLDVWEQMKGEEKWVR